MKHYAGTEEGYSSDSSDNSDLSFGTETSSEDQRSVDFSLDDEKTEADFGILFDVDGVLARGSTPLSAAVQAVRLLQDNEGRMKVPVAFVTNACNRSMDKARQIGSWLDIPVSPDQVIHAPTPAKLLTEFHNKHVLVVGQEHRVEIAKDLGFTKVCTIEDIQRAYPLLDMVDHENRITVSKGNHHDDTSFEPVEAVLLIGEPTRWESHLQLLIDLLVSEGTPVSGHTPKSVADVKQLPVIACNMDLVFMHQACMPRFGHGAFLVCLEALYRKITGKDLEYTALIGKPCEITYRYAEHVIADVAKQLGISKSVQKLYFVGDNPNVDVYGANLYDRYLKRQQQTENNNGNDVTTDSVDLPLSRSIPKSASLMTQTVKSMESLLVGTGVFKQSETTETEVAGSPPTYHGHRDIEHEPELSKPSKFVPDVCLAVRHILDKERFRMAFAS